MIIRTDVLEPNIGDCYIRVVHRSRGGTNIGDADETF